MVERENFCSRGKKGKEGRRERDRGNEPISPAAPKEFKKEMGDEVIGKVNISRLRLGC